MAKQSGIHQLKGKIRGMSYYRQKGVEDGLARSINQGLSKRVKEDVAYANTRLNAAEFGSAGAFAGAAIRAISDRQRAMLKDFATGMVAKFVKDLIVLDSVNPWGQRQLEGTGWVDDLMQYINTFAKNDFGYYVGGVWDSSMAGEDQDDPLVPNAELASGWGQPLIAKGATGAYIDIYGYQVVMDAEGKGAKKSVSNVQVIGSENVTIGESVTFTTGVALDFNMQVVAERNVFPALLVVVRPYKEINNKKYIMQELCTFKLNPIKVG